jgi:hypothetical protein
MLRFDSADLAGVCERVISTPLLSSVTVGYREGKRIETAPLTPLFMGKSPELI